MNPETSGSKNFARLQTDNKRAEAYALLIQNRTMTLKEASKRVGIAATTLVRWRADDFAAGMLPLELDVNRFRTGHEPEKRKQVKSLLRQGLSTKRIHERTRITECTIKKWRAKDMAGMLVSSEESASSGLATSSATALDFSDIPEVSGDSSDVLVYVPRNRPPFRVEVRSESSAWGNDSEVLR